MFHVSPDLSNDWYFEIIFNFYNKDIIRIKAENFSLTFIDGDIGINPYDGTVFWHRLSGPD
jgi:hypothetical protein